MPKSSNHYYVIKTDKKLERQGSILIKELKSNRIIQEKPEDSRHHAAGALEGAEFIEQNQSERSIKQDTEVSPLKTGNHHLDLHFKPTSENFSFGKSNNGHLSNSSAGSSKASPGGTGSPLRLARLTGNELVAAAHKQLSLQVMKVGGSGRQGFGDPRRAALPSIKS